MSLSRRSFNLASLTLFMASAAKMSAASASLETPLSAKALNRLTFGANAAARKEFEHLGLEAWLDRELAKPASNDDFKRRLSTATLLIEYEADRDDNKHSWPARKEIIPYAFLDASPKSLLPLIDYDKHGMSYEERIRPAREVQAASLIRAVHADAQLREMMTQFWHDHFSVNSMRDEHTAAYFILYDRMMRDNAFGNFRQLLGEVTKSPSMLYYLNNEASRASPANENFARELFELHTLGVENYVNDQTTNWADVPGAKDGLASGYIDQDVYEAARALTGWSFGDGREVAAGDNAPLSGQFHYIDRWHDPYQKRILGAEFRANSGPMEDGEKLLDMLARHPGTARFVCAKICRRLLADEPPDSLVDKAVQVWSGNFDAPDQIAQVVRAIALSPEFAAAPPQKLKRPFEFMASFYRAVGAEVASPPLDFIWTLSQAGWNQHECRPPTGHPDIAEHWANTNLVSGFANMALNALEDWNNTAKLDLAAATPAEITSAADAARHWSLQMHGRPLADDAVNLTAAQLAGDAGAALPDDPGERQGALRGIVAAAALSPQFLFR